MIRIAETFGFHLVSLDVRQESSSHTRAVSEILRPAGDVEYEKLDENQRLALLAKQIESGTRPEFDKSQLDQENHQTLEVFETIREMREQIGQRCIGSYVISMTHCASHIMDVMYLGFAAGLAGRHWGDVDCSLDIAPLVVPVEGLGHLVVVLDSVVLHKG